VSATTYTLELADTLPSLNTLLYRHWATQRRAKAGLQAALEGVLMAAGLPRPLGGRVTATAELTFPTRHRRDEDNYRSTLSKCLADALVNGRWLPNDTLEHLAFRGLTFSPDRGPHRTVVRLEVAP
jgi:hypothetical protein